MKLVQEYSSHSSRSSRSESPGFKVDPTPNVNIQSLVLKESEDRRRAIAIHDEDEQREKKHLTGKVEVHAINEQVFREQFYNYNTFGIIVDPEKGGNKFLKKRAGADNVYDEIDGDEVLVNRLSVFAASSKTDRDLTKIIKERRTKAGDPSSADFMGPWAHYEGEEQFDKVNKTAEDIREGMKKTEEDRKQKLEARKLQEDFSPSSTFHGDELYDYKGRSYILPPQDLNIASDNVNYIPKKPVHTYTGHKKGIMVAKFFPKFGHYILSGGYDNEVKLWDVYRDRKCMRTYSGHKNAIKDLSLANDGMHFLSTGWDDRINYWDTETGQVVQTFKLPAHPFCGKLNPDDTKQYMFLVGDVDKKVSQYDIRSGELVCTYNDHLGPVNTVTFVDDNRKFASTSDDKKVFLWEFGIPIVVKHISDPEMHAVTATDLHPEGKYFIGQASDNRVMCYDVKGGTIRLNKKKKFTGHISAGHSISCKISPDGQFVASGDQDGRVFFWDWKSARVYSVLEAHSKVCIAVDWHPHENSTFLTAGWDANIRIWNA
jgi:pre-mRNA-processing factor 17